MTFGLFLLFSYYRIMERPRRGEREIVYKRTPYPLKFWVRYNILKIVKTVSKMARWLHVLTNSKWKFHVFHLPLWKFLKSVIHVNECEMVSHCGLCFLKDSNVDCVCVRMCVHVRVCASVHVPAPVICISFHKNDCSELLPIFKMVCHFIDHFIVW